MEWNVYTVGAAVAGVLLFIWFARIYNALVEVRNDVKKSWANIDVLCKQRHDELPKLVAACQEYMGYEQETLQQVMEARGNVQNALDNNDASEFSQAEGGLRQGLGKLFALAENYPDLKATNSFQQLQSRISGLENAIADRRELYNAAVTDNNTMIRQFPNMFLARALQFNPQPLLEFTAEEIADVDVKDLFKR